MAGQLVALPTRPDTIRPIIVGDKTKEYVVANYYSSNQKRILRFSEDDVEREVSFRAYDKMERDGSVIKCKNILITNTLCDDLQLAPGATEDEVGEEEYRTYIEIMEFSARVLNGLDSPLRGSNEQLLGNAIKYGHGIAEIEWEYRKDAPSTKPQEVPQKGRLSSAMSRFRSWFAGNVTAGSNTDPGVTRPILAGEKTRLMPKCIKVKPRTAVHFVVDDYLNVLGLAPRLRGQTLLAFNEIVDRDKFMILTLNKHDEDPRGKSMYRAAYNWYNVRVNLPSEMVRYVIEETVPKAVATLPEGAPPFEFERDENGNILYDDPDTKQSPRMQTAAESFKSLLEGFRSGSGAVIPHGATLEPYKKGLTGSNDAELFNKLLKITGDEIEGSILQQTLAQSEGQHQSKSASEQVAEILYNLIFYLRWQLGQVILNDILATTIKVNYGEWALRYIPQISLGDFIRRDWVAELEAYADAYFKGLIDDTQRPAIMASLNLPRPGPSRQSQNLEAAAKADVNGQPIQPNDNRPDKSGAGQGRNSGNGTEKNGKQQNTGRRPNNSLGHHTGWVRRASANIRAGY